MRSETRRNRARTAPGVATNVLTASIVGVVVLVNSVAWGIPLLTGDGDSDPARNAKRLDSITTGAIPRPERRPEMEAGATSPVPLPVLSPMPAVEPSGSDVSGRRGAGPRSPKTLYPLPESAPSQLLVPPSKPASTPPETRVTRTASAPTFAWRDTARVSPYAPGVRMKQLENAAPSTKRPPAQAYELAKDTTLERARQIARRAAERFEAMRARLDAPQSSRQAGLSSQTLPLGARPPTASLIGSTSASKSAFAYVRPRIVRRPIEPAAPKVQSAPVAIAAAPVTPVDLGSIRNRAEDAGRVEPSAPAQQAAIASDAVPVPSLHHRPRQMASLTKSPSTAKQRTTRPSVARAARPVRRDAAQRRLKRRITRLKNRGRRVASRRPQRKIDGFRPSFHRQLVSANFFSGSQH